MTDTKIKKDEKGLYTASEGWICRPRDSEPTMFKEGDKIRFSHPAGGLGFLRVGKRGSSDFHEEAWDVIELISYYENPSLYNKFEDAFWDSRSSFSKRGLKN